MFKTTHFPVPAVELPTPDELLKEGYTEIAQIWRKAGSGPLPDGDIIVQARNTYEAPHHWITAIIQLARTAISLNFDRPLDEATLGELTRQLLLSSSNIFAEKKPLKPVVTPGYEDIHPGLLLPPMEMEENEDARQILSVWSTPEDFAHGDSPASVQVNTENVSPDSFGKLLSMCALAYCSFGFKGGKDQMIATGDIMKAFNHELTRDLPRA